MYIKSIVLDGFKSYANRTVISGFDKNFNAITGLNGSGKSNILDAICFVLGITQLQKVRVNNLQELVYKQGQARVTKASVSIVFDNLNKEESPAGYESSDEITVTRQIIVGGRNKYIINGHNALANRVHSFFQSVHLNINNPHFLIMQGKITKVLGMKPLEILGMVEEAAGTRMYETKRNYAMKTIKKKETKLAQIEKTLEEEINPQLKKLKSQKEHYITWSSNQTEIERIKRFKVAFTFFKLSRNANDKVKDKEKMETEVTALNEELLDVKADIKTLTIQIDNLTNMKTEKEEKNLDNCEKLLADLSKSLTKEKAILTNKKSLLVEENSVLEETNSDLNKNKKSLDETRENAEERNTKFKQHEEKWLVLQEKMGSLQGRQLGFSIGDDENTKSKGSLTSQLMQSQEVDAKLETKARNLTFRLQEVEKNILKRKKTIKSVSGADSELLNLMSTKEKEIREKEIEMEREKDSVERAETIKKTIREEENRMEAMDRNMSKFQIPKFKYSDPYRGFDRSKVFGFVFALFTIKDKKFSEAIEIAAGNKLKNVVIDSQNTAKSLLKHKSLQYRVTMIPLDKVNSRRLNESVISESRRVSQSDEVYLAADCISYDRKFEKAMQLVFGTTIICKDMESAKRVAYGQKTRIRTVTLDGELFETTGTMIGGSRANRTPFLSRQEQYNKLKIDAEQKKAKVDKLKIQSESLRGQCKKFYRDEERCEILKYELKGLENRAENSQGGVLKRELNKLVEERKCILEEIEVVESTRRKNGLKMKELEKQMGGKSEDNESVERQISQIKKDLSAAEKTVSSWKRKVEYDSLEIETMAKEIEKLELIKKQSESKILKYEEENNSLEKDIETLKNKHSEAEEELNQTKQRINSLTEKTNSLNKKRLENEQNHETSNLRLKKLENELNRFEKSQKESIEKIKMLEKEHKWINEEKQLFGKSSSDYDFEAVKPDFVASRLKNLMDQQQDLSSRINKKVLVMFDKAEQDYNNLVKNRKIVLGNKIKIEKTIIELDRKKDEVLARTFDKVNRNFGKIFEVLLPGASAKLIRADGESLRKGIEVVVAFGGAWKESLSELSGGQRSLLALALILSLLLFKPAPMYILDEIDAALDLSHTQNIGRLLASHFARSQFIVVSLKEGMFNHANVRYDVKFIKGVSSVTRNLLQ